MTLDEIYKDLANPDKAPEAILQLREVITEKDSQISALTNARTEDAKRIADLTDTNGRLVLRITGEPDEEPEEDKPKSRAEILAEFYKKKE